MKNFYLEEFNDLLGDIKNEDEFKEVLPKLIFYGIKYINNSTNDLKDLELAKQRVDFIQLILALVAQSSPRGLYETFPIEERFTFNNKEMCATAESQGYIEVGREEAFFSNVPLNNLWHYGNKDTSEFVLNADHSIVNYHILNGSTLDRKEHISDFIKENTIGTAKFFLSPGGKAYLINPEGKKVSLKRQYPGYLKTVKRSDSNVE